VGKRAQRAIDREDRTADPPLTPPLQGGERASQPSRTPPSRLRVEKGVSREAAKDCDPDVLTHSTKPPAPLRRQGPISRALRRAREKEMDACLRRQAGRDGGFATKEKFLPIGNRPRCGYSLPVINCLYEVESSSDPCSLRL